MYRSELSYFVNGTGAAFAANGSVSLHSPVSGVAADSSSATDVRIGQSADGMPTHTAIIYHCSYVLFIIYLIA